MAGTFRYTLGGAFDLANSQDILRSNSFKTPLFQEVDARKTLQIGFWSEIDSMLVGGYQYEQHLYPTTMWGGLNVDFSDAGVYLDWSGQNTEAVFFGGDYSSVLIGGSAGDTLVGKAADDVLIGRDGNDVLRGGAGTNTLTGGSGNDTFQGSQAELQDDIITDFAIGDRIVLPDSYYGMWVANLAIVDTLVSGRLDISEFGSLVLQGDFAGKIWNAKSDPETNTTTLMINSAPLAADDHADADELGRAIGNVIQGAPDGIGRDIDLEGDTISVAISQAPTRGVVAFGSNGSYTYTANAQTLNAVKALGAGGTMTDTFTYQTSDPIGATDTGQVTITLHGVNDVAVIDGMILGEVAEDAITTVSGMLTVNDVDVGESAFRTQDDIRGAYGVFSFNAIIGRWTYALDVASAALQALTSGAVAHETFAVKVLDGTEQLITLTVRGTNDATVVGGITAGEVTEDATTAISGTLMVSDPDTGEGKFQAQANVKGAYGVFSFDASTGAWTYRLDNSSAALQALTANTVAQETFTVRTYDGTEQTVTVTVNGADDPVVTPNTPGGAVDIVITDPSQLTAALGTSGIDQVIYGGSGTVILPGNVENITLTVGNAHAQGNALGNVMRGSAGDNALWSAGGNDWVHSGDGHDTVDGGTGRDYIFGGTGNDLVQGGAGNDSVNGGSSNDRVNGGSGNDLVSGSAGNDTVNGGSGNDTVKGGSGRDRVYGDAGQDIVTGGIGNDTVNGGAGNDTLYGNAGRDVFVFDTKLSKGSNVDTIKDFNVANDSLWFDNAIFTTIGRGSAKGIKLAADMFVSGMKAQDAEDRIIYDRITGALYYDQDGTGSAGQVKFATISNKAKLTYHDFFVV